MLGHDGKFLLMQTEGLQFCTGPWIGQGLLVGMFVEPSSIPHFGLVAIDRMGPDGWPVETENWLVPWDEIVLEQGS